MEDQEFINQLAEKLNKLGTVRPLGFHYLHPYGTVPADSIICNGATYSRALYKDFFDYITTQGWVKTEAEWQEIATRDNGFCPFYSSGDDSTNFRTPKFAPYQQIAIAGSSAGTYHQAGLSNIEGTLNTSQLTDGSDFASGTLIVGGSVSRATTGSGPDDSQNGFSFDASRSNAIYGRSSTVQPESHEWVLCVVVTGQATNLGSVDMADVLSATTQVQAEVASIQQAIGNTAKFAAPAYGSGSQIAANTTVTIQSNGFLRYSIHMPGTGGKDRTVMINGVGIGVHTDNGATKRDILPVLKGDSVSHDGVDELVFYPARYGA